MSLEVERLPIVGVMGSSQEPHEEKAQQVGKWLATLNIHLLTGGGKGVMESVSRAFYQVPNRAGKVIGIIPSAKTDAGYQAKPGYPNQWVEIPIVTHLPHSGLDGTDPMSRNHINILSSDAIIALPGSSGTSSEVKLALHYGKPIIAYLDDSTEIEDLVKEVVIESDFKRVKEFVESVL